MLVSIIVFTFVNVKNAFVEREKQRQTVQKQIEALKAKIKKEKQLNKQMEMNNELKNSRENWRKSDGENENGICKYDRTKY